MAFSRNLMTCEGKDLVMVVFTFATNGASDPVLGADKTGIQSITHTGAGQYTVKFAQVYPEYVGGDAHLALHTAADSRAILGPYTVGTSSANPAAKYSQIVVTTLTSGSAADIAAATDNQITIWMVFRRTSVQT